MLRAAGQDTSPEGLRLTLIVEMLYGGGLRVSELAGLSLAAVRTKESFIRITGKGRGPIAVSVGGTLKSGRFIGHFIHLDESCEGRVGGPVVLESGDDDRLFSLAAAPKGACQ